MELAEVKLALLLAFVLQIAARDVVVEAIVALNIRGATVVEAAFSASHVLGWLVGIVIVKIVLGAVLVALAAVPASLKVVI